MRVPRSVTPRPFSRLPGLALIRGADVESSALTMGVLLRAHDNADGKGQARQNALAARAVAPGKFFHNVGGSVHGAFLLSIGVHAGPAVVGHMGYGDATYLTSVGDTVHVASRLEELTKTYACALVISDEVAPLADVEVSGCAT